MIDRGKERLRQMRQKEKTQTGFRLRETGASKERYY